MQKTPFDYKDFKSETYLKYNIDLDETSASILFILQDEQKTAFEKQANLLSDATEKINSSSRTLALDYNNPRWQAFWFGFGNMGLALIIALFIACGFLWYFTYTEKKQEELSALNQWYKAYYDNTVNLSRKAMVDYLRSHPMP